MNMHQTCAALAALFALAACGQQDGSKPGLTGADRTSFIESTVTSCNAAAKTNPQAAQTPPAIIAQYCTCSASVMADKMTPDQMHSIDANKDSNPAEARAVAKPLIDAAANACRAILRRAPN